MLSRSPHVLAAASPDEGNRVVKKVRFRQEEPPDLEGMQVDELVQEKTSFRDTLLGASQGAEKHREDTIDDPFMIGEEDVERIFDEVEPRIVFKERIMTLVEKSMRWTVVVKLLGRTIGYNALQNRLFAIWKPNGQLFMMDLENDYYQVTFNDVGDYKRALSEGPWVVYGHNLSIQPWSPEFSPSNPHPTSIVVWIRIRGVPGAFYKRPLVTAIGEMVGKVVRIDYNTSTATRGRFARIAVSVDLSKVLKSRVWVNGTPYNIEYEALPLICFGCGKYGHLKAACPGEVREEMQVVGEGAALAPAPTNPPNPPGKFSSWMVVERKSRRTVRDGSGFGKDSIGSRLAKDTDKSDKNSFAALSDMIGTQRDSRRGKMVEMNEDSEVACNGVEEDLVRFSPQQIAALSLEEFAMLKEANLGETCENNSFEAGPKTKKAVGHVKGNVKAQAGKGSKILPSPSVGYKNGGMGEKTKDGPGPKQTLNDLVLAIRKGQTKLNPNQHTVVRINDSEGTSSGESMVNKNMENSGNLSTTKGPRLAGLFDPADHRPPQTEPPDVIKDVNSEALIPVAEAVSTLKKILDLDSQMEDVEHDVLGESVHLG